MPKRTPLFDLHLQGGAKMVDFAGWAMPLHYGSQIDEHLAVRAACGIFDVSHMRVIDLEGPGSLPFLRALLANDAGRLVGGRALYSCMLRDDGGVIDDLIVYRLGPQDEGDDLVDAITGVNWADDDDAGAASGPAERADFRVVVNAATAERDLDWMAQRLAALGPQAAARAPVVLRPRPDFALIAVQGPQARAILAQAAPRLSLALSSLAPFSCASAGGWFVARTGYTGEDGCEVAVPVADAADLWRALRARGAAACGLGARDTLRLEAGLNLYGNDMDESVSPLESGLGWTVDLRTPRDFIGRGALERQQARGGLRQLLGLRLADRGILRPHQRVSTPQGPGEITSGGYAPSLSGSIALARLPAGTRPGDKVEVELRTGPAPAIVCRPPFVRNGKVLV